MSLWHINSEKVTLKWHGTVFEFVWLKDKVNHVKKEVYYATNVEKNTGKQTQFH